jgi:hypothetical protein
MELQKMVSMRIVFSQAAAKLTVQQLADAMLARIDDIHILDYDYFKALRKKHEQVFDRLKREGKKITPEGP